MRLEHDFTVTFQRDESENCSFDRSTSGKDSVAERETEGRLGEREREREEGGGQEQRVPRQFQKRFSTTREGKVSKQPRIKTKTTKLTSA